MKRTKINKKRPGLAHFFKKNNVEVVVADLEEHSPPTPDVRGSNAVIGKLYILSNCIEKTKIKKKRPGIAHLKTFSPHAMYTLRT